MKKILWINLPIMLILLLSLVLRWWHYGDYPLMGETKDEYAYTWAGNSLLRGQPPTSWSWYEHYQQKYKVKLLGETYPIVTPWFDSPPLFSIIPGLMTVLGGSNGITIPSITLIRFPMIFLGTLNVFLLYIMAKTWFDKKTAVYSSLFYATVPLLVFSSRMVLIENLIITWLLFSLWLIKKFLAGPSKSIAIALGMVAGLAVLTKVSGVIVFASIILILYLNTQFKFWVPLIVSFMAVSLLWLVHGWMFGLDIFIETLTRQGSLEVGWASLIQLFIHPTLVEKVWVDGWFYLGIIAIMLYMFIDSRSRRKVTANPIFLVPIIWLALYLVSVRELTWHGWYRYPLFPFMALAWGRWFARGMTTTVRLLPFILLGLLPSLRMLLFINSINLTYSLSKIVIVVLMLVGGLDLMINLNHKWRQRVIVLAFACLIIVNSLVIFSITNPGISVYEQYFLFPI